MCYINSRFTYLLGKKLIATTQVLIPPELDRQHLAAANELPQQKYA